ncbi:MAG: metal ABC transporter ATP-binding protein [Candidatus Moraniibacteriota bacterium]
MRQIDHTQNIIEIENVSFSYNDNGDVLKDITLAIHQGDYIGLIGPNGAGKTTLLKIMLNLLTPKTGSVKLFEQDLREFKDWQKIGYVPQKAVHFDANFPASVFEVVLMGRYSNQKLFQRTTRDDKEAVRDALEKVGLWKQKDRLIGDLSGGQQQRVFIARALVNQPEIIFLDEPTTGVDQETQNEFYTLLRKLNEELDLTLVLVSHDIERVVREVMHIVCVNITLVCHTSPEDYLAESTPSNVRGKDVHILHHHYHK